MNVHRMLGGLVVVAVVCGACGGSGGNTPTSPGATVKIVAPKVGGAKLADGSMLAADGQLAGTPSVLFDAVAVILSAEGAKALSIESAAIDFVRDAFGHLKAIAVDKGGQVLLKIGRSHSMDATNRQNTSDGFIHFNVCRGRLLSSLATALRSALV